MLHRVYLNLPFKISFKASKTIEKIFSHFFFLFFCCQILSPSVNEVSVYLELFIAILNPYFLLWVLLKIRINRNVIISVVLIVLATLISNASFFILVKIFSTLVGILFLFYASEKDLLFLFPYLKLSIITGLAQFVLLFFEPRASFFIGPTSISSLIWGEYAIKTFTNFYTIFFFPRVSGLSREAGFLASFLIGTILLCQLEKRHGKLKVSMVDRIILCIGYIISFSKMSLILLIITILQPLEKIFNSVSPLSLIGAFVIFMIIFWTSQTSYLSNPKNITFAERFGAYATILELEANQLIFGESDIKNIETRIGRILHKNEKFYNGYGGLIITNGLIFSFICLLILNILGITNTGLLILILLTINVNFFTNQNFVTLAYFIVFKYYRRSTNCMILD